MLFSVIIPAYNTAEFISDCIESILTQDFPKNEYEIIVVDDKSPDNLKDIVKTYIKKYKNIKLIIHEINKHQGGARNTAIKNAKGEYIFFLDSDDKWIRRDVFSVFFDQIKKSNKSCDILKSSQFIGFINNESFIKTPKLKVKSENMSGKRYLKSSYYFPNIWTGVYKKNFLLENNLFFRENVFFEDTDWTIKSFYYAKNVCINDYLFYGYRYNNNSTTTVPKIQTFHDNISSAIVIFDFIEENIIDKPIEEALFNILNNIIYSFLKYSRNYKIRQSLLAIKRLKKKNIISKCKKHSDNNSFSLFFLNKMTFLSCFLIRFATLSKRKLKNLFK